MALRKLDGRKREVHMQKAGELLPLEAEIDSPGIDETRDLDEERRMPIVSVHGRDVESHPIEAKDEVRKKDKAA